MCELRFFFFFRKDFIAFSIQGVPDTTVHFLIPVFRYHNI